MSPKKKINITNKVREYCESRGIDKNQFIAKCLSSPLTTDTGRALTANTVIRIYNGDTEISLSTAGLIAGALEVSISEVFDIKH